MHFGILVFPGTNCEQDTLHVLCRVLGHTAELVWHSTLHLGGFDAIVIPGGFAHGDYLRTGAIARFSPVMDAVSEFAANGRPVLGICNGFQILCEAGLLPGALRRNAGLHFICRDAFLKVERNDNPFLNMANAGEVLRMPIRHGEGSYFADAQTLADMESKGQVLLRYSSRGGHIGPETNPNGSVGNIAGICNQTKNVFGLMPHPEAASESIVGGTDGLIIFRSIISAMESSGSLTADLNEALAA